MKYCLVWLWVMCFAEGAWGMFRMPEQVPVERLEKNIAAFVAKHPKDPAGYYALGRVHYLAVAKKTGTVGVFSYSGDGKAKLPTLAPTILQNGSGAKEGPTDKEIALHVRKAIENLRKAIKLDPTNGLYHLTLASLLEATPGGTAMELGGFVPGESTTRPADAAAEEAIGQLASADPAVRDHALVRLRELGAGAVPILVKHAADPAPEVRGKVIAALKGYWEESAAAEYKSAYELSVEVDQKRDSKPLLGMNELTSYEAGEHYLGLINKRQKSSDEKAEEEKIGAGLRKLNQIPPGPVTPIVFSMEGSPRLAELIESRFVVAFDLDATARQWRWTWPKAKTGILVWDPEGTGRITSGRQLFGNVTFGLFWQDGYHALAALDDNEDGVLAGDELEGLAIWFDRNSNGVSDVGEVVPLSLAGVSEISVVATSVDLDCPVNLRGVTLKDGRHVGSYDWIAKPTARR